SIPTEQILALGLIANELVTNAKKHGAGNIKVTFRTAGRGEYELCVLDEGKGLPAGFAPNRHSAGGLGMKLVALLVSQLDGRLSAGGNPAGRGARFTVTRSHTAERTGRRAPRAPP
ncbi:MAG TPA: ATP-binding protein, partial [Reyranella sp.]|nr:ATP-binding protein [Reyranella sp.]